MSEYAKTVTIYGYGKINLSIDVLGVQEDGLHQVDMIMQSVELKDHINIKYIRGNTPQWSIELTCDKPYVPCDQRNLAYKACQMMIDRYGEKLDISGGIIKIDIKKWIPVSGGMAGGSADCAAVIHGLNYLWKLNLSLDEMMGLGGSLGSDVPFCISSQAWGNKVLKDSIKGVSRSYTCARAIDTGKVLTPVKPLKAVLVLARPAISVSTKEVYQGIDDCKINVHPDNDKLVQYLESNQYVSARDEMINVLENYTLNAKKKVARLKRTMEEMVPDGRVLMSGSGPTIFAICNSFEQAKEACKQLREKGYTAYWTKTMW